MYYLVVAKVDAHMYDAAFGVAEEAEVVALRRRQGGDGGALGDLLRGVAEEGDATGLETYLSEAGAVDAHDRAAAPEVGGTEVVGDGHVAGRGVAGGGRRRQGVGGGGAVLLVVDPALVAVVMAADARPLGLPLEDVEGVAQQELVDHLGFVGGFEPHGDGAEETIASHVRFY